MNNLINSFPGDFDNRSRRVINTPSWTARKALFYVQETGYLKLIRSHHTKRHNLDSYLFVNVVEGEGTLTYNGVSHALRKGECFLIDCRREHSYQSSTENPWALLWVHFNGASSSGYYKIYEDNDRIHFCPENADEVKAILERLITVNQEGGTAGELISSQLIVQLLTLGLIDKSYNHSSQDKITDIKDYIDENFTTEISLESLEKNYFLSKYYITRTFKKIYGVTIFEHIIAQRINYAKRLLRFSDDSIAEISQKCGFNDQSYFNRQFKKLEGITASAFRNKWKY